MTLRFSTGLRNAMLDSTGLKAGMADGVIEIYSGSQPAAADDAIQGTYLGRVSESAGAWAAGAATNGLEFDAAAGGVIAKAAAETWKMVTGTPGTAGWFRFIANAADSEASSLTLLRIDGAIGTFGAELNLSSVVLGAAQVVTIDTFQLTLPAAGS